MSFYGMDTAQVQDHASTVDEAARRLEDILGQLSSTVGGVGWIGPDADAFQNRFTQVRGKAASAADDLRSRADVLRDDVDEQDRASADGGFFEGLLDWLGDMARGITDAIARGIEWLGNTISDGIDWVGDRVRDGAETIGDAIERGIDWAGDRISDGLGWAGDRLRDGARWVGDRVSDGLDWVGDRVEDGKRLLDRAVEAVKDRAWSLLRPEMIDRVAETVRGIGDFIDSKFGTDLNWVHDGTGYADPPQRVTAEESGYGAPSDLSDIIGNTQKAYGDDAETGNVSMTVIRDAQGNPQGVIVNIPGTEQWSPSAGDNPFDLTGNAELAGSSGTSAGTQATADAIRQLYEDAGIPPGTPLMLNGHSQGGMVAASLAGDSSFTSEFNVTNVMTVGSPVDNLPAAPGVNQINIQHDKDVVPHLDGDGRGAGGQPVSSATGETVTLDSPYPPVLITGNHSVDKYRESVAEQLQDPNSALSKYQSDSSMDPFLTNNPSQVEHYESQVHRRQTDSSPRNERLWPDSTV